MELTGATIIRVPETLNPITVRDLREGIEAALSAPVRTCVLVGNDQAFCRGLDLNSVETDSSSRDAVETFAGCLEIIRSGPVPVIAYVKGTTSGGGIGLAAACDAVLASPNATFALPELVFGLTPAVILPYLAQRISVQKLRWLAMSVKTLRAEDALQIGLIDEVVDDDKALLLIKSWVRNLARLDTTAVRRWKQMTLGAPSLQSNEGVQATLDALGEVHVRQGLKLFMETGEPPWNDRDQ